MENSGAQSQNNLLNPALWVKQYADCLFSYALLRVNDKNQAEDLVQDTFLSGFKAKETFKGECSEKTWLIGILKRKIIDFYRKRATQGIQQTIESEQSGADYGHFFNEDGDKENHWSNQAQPHTWSGNGLKNIESKEFYDILNKCLSLLPGKWASVFSMRNMEDIESEIICKELKLSSSNYWVIVHRAKLQLRECMEKNWFERK